MYFFETNKLPFLRPEEQLNLLDEIDALDHFNSLRTRFCATDCRVGDESSGKRSSLEGTSAVPFLRKATLGIRFLIELIIMQISCRP